MQKSRVAGISMLRWAVPASSASAAVSLAQRWEPTAEDAEDADEYCESELATRYRW